jgi:flagellar biosynthesis protein FlhG
MTDREKDPGSPEDEADDEPRVPDELAPGEARVDEDDEIEELIEPALAPDAAEPPEDEEPTRVVAAPEAPAEGGPPAEPEPAVPARAEAATVAVTEVAMVAEKEAQGRAADDDVPRLVLSVAGGKGGVGKSVLAASIGIYLAQLGKRVTLVDANLGSPNLHTLLGIDEPRTSLHSFLSKDVRRIEEVVAETPIPGLGLIPGHDNGVGAANPRPAQKQRLLQQLRTLDVEYVVIDLAAGTDYNTLDLFLAADLHIVVTHPESTAVESAFRLIKSAFIRKVQRLRGLEQLLEDLVPSAYAGVVTPFQLYSLARERDPEVGDELHRAMGEFKPRFLVNKTRTRDDLELGPELAVIGRRHLGLPVDYLGYVENDDTVWVTVRRRKPLLVEYPDTKVCKDIERIVRRILSLETKERPECIGVPKTLLQQNHYEILGLHPGAADEEVRRAHRRMKRIYGPESAAILGIAPPSEVTLMHQRIEAAYATLVDPEKRHRYNQNIFPGGLVPAVAPGTVSDHALGLPAVVGAAAASPPELLEEAEVTPLERLPEMPPIEEETAFTGELLRRVREAKGIDLLDIADRTKISITYLRAIESEDFAVMPAPVYLRGFVKTLSRQLKLDPERVARSYMERFEEAAHAAASTRPK